MDTIDRKILEVLQHNAGIAGTELAKSVGISSTPCWRRVQRLEEDNVIQRRVALLDAVKVNVGATIFVFIKVKQHSPQWLSRFSEVVRSFPEVLEFYRMSGDIDYLLRVVVPDVAGYDAFYKRLIAKVEVGSVNSKFAMQELKATTELPLHYMVTSNPNSALNPI